MKTSEKPLDLLSQELKELTEGIQEFQEKAFESLYSKKVLWSLDWSKSNSGDDSIRSDVVASAIEETGATSTPTEESVPVPAVAPVAEPVSEPASTPVLITDVSSVKKIDPPAVATKTGKVPAPLIASKETIISEAAVSATSTSVLTAGSAGGMESDVSVLLKDVPVDTTESVDPNVEKLQILKAQQTISKSFLSLSEEENESTVTEARVAPAAARISSSSSSAKQPLDSIFDIFKSDATAKKDAPKDSNVVSKITTASTVTQQPLVEVPPTPTVVVPPPVVIKKPSVAPSPAIQSPLLSGLFGFLSPSPGFQGSATPTKKTTAAPPKPSLSVPEVEDSPTILPPQEEAFAKKSVELVAPPPRATTSAAVKSADSSTAATKSKGLFGFLGDSSEDFFEDDPTSTSSKGKRLLVSAVTDADEERDVAPPTAVKSVETKSTSGGLFGFFSPPSTAPAKKLSVVSEVEKDEAAPVVTVKAKVVAPPAVEQASLKVPVKAVVKDVNKAAKPFVEEVKEEAKPESSIAAKTSSVGGGFFGFLNQAPAAPVKKSVAPAVVAPPVVKLVTPIAKKELVATPIIKKEAKTSSSGGGGLFGFLNPSPAAIKKPVVVVPDVEAKPEAPALSPSRKLSNPLNAKPAAPKSVTISSVAKIVLPPVVKQVAPKVIVKDVNKAARPAVVEVKEEAKPESSVAAKTSSVGGGFFGFLNQAPAAPVKKSEAAQINTSPIAAVRPAPPMVSKPIAPPQQQQRRPQEKAKPLNLFGFLDSSENFFEDQPSSLPPASNVKGPVSPLPPKVESPVTAKTSSVGGGFFGFLNQAPAAPVKKSVAPAVVSKVAPPVVKPVTPIAKKELVATPIIKKEAKTSSSGGGGLFGFLNPPPAAIKKPVVVVPEVKASGSPPAVEVKKTNFLNARPAASKIAAPVVKSTAVVATKTTSSGGGGLFGFFNPSPALSVKKPIVEPTAATVPVASPLTKKVTNPLNGKPAVPKSNAVPSLKTEITKVVAGKAPVKELVAAPIIKKEAKTSSSGGGGLFGFLNPSPAAIKKPVVVVPEATAPIVKKEAKTSSSGGGGLFGFLNPSPAAIKKPVVIVPEVKAPGSPPAVEAKKTNPLNARPAASKVVLPPPVTKSTPSSMDKSFQLSVSKLLKGDTKKIMLFQKATDSFRSGGISAADYIMSLEKLFGSDVLGLSIIPPLTAQLPEKDRASELRKAYEQTRKTGSSKDKKTTK